MVDRGDPALAARRPDPPQDRLQPDAVLVGGEDLDDRAGVARGFLRDGFGEFLWDGPPLPPAPSYGAGVFERKE